jgi:hypothetical protein
MSDRLTRPERLRILGELCPKGGSRRPCDSFELAQARAVEILGSDGRAELTADYLLMRAVDRYAAGEMTLDDLYRCRVLAYYMTFASGGEEWSRWGVVAKVNPGDFPELETAEFDLAELDELPQAVPEGPPWRE